MSVQSAMRSAVSGLSAQSSRMAAISDNIANAQTIGYKRSSVSFSAMIAQSQGGYQAGGVASASRTEVSKLGIIQNGTSATDMAVAGRGFFVVSGSGGNAPVLTRAGSFRPDAEGYLVNASGYRLMGWPLGPDGKAGSVDYDAINSLKPVNIASAGATAQPTTNVFFSGNVPSRETGPGAPSDPFRSSVEYFDPLGNSKRLFIEWQPSTTENQWILSVSDSDGNPYGSVDVEFASSGPQAGAPVSYSNMTGATPGFAFDPDTGKMSITAAAGTGTQDITISFGAPGGFGGVTQFADDFNPKTTRDGAPVGTLQGVEVTEDGRVVGVFSNNTRRALWQIPLADVTNPDGLVPGDGNTFQVSQDSGAARLYDANSNGVGAVVGGALEGSNVDIAEELTDLIVTQRAYSTNAKIIQTADEMLEEAGRLKR